MNQVYVDFLVHGVRSRFQVHLNKFIVDGVVLLQVSRSVAMAGPCFPLVAFPRDFVFSIFSI